MSTKEVQLDADHLLNLIQSDSVCDYQMELLDHHQAAEAVVDSFNVLFTAPKPSDERPLNLTAEENLVVCFFQQWLVRYFCKRLMQLMTSEALILNRNKIPSSYLVNYLSYQSHFSLKELVNRYYSALVEAGRYAKNVQS